MLVILQKDIKKLGVKSKVHKVRAGYARNYLIPFGYAVPANEANMAKLEKNRKEIEKNNAEILHKARKLAESMKNVSLSVMCKANSVDGKLFGSVTARDVVRELEKYNVVISSKDVILPVIKKIGDYVVEIILHPEIALKLPLLVRPIKDDSSL